MQNGFFSDVQVDSVKVVGCSLWVNPEPPEGQMHVDTSIELSNPAIQTDPATGTLSSPMTMGVSVSYSDGDQPETPRAKLSVKLSGRVVAQPGAQIDAHGARMAAVSQMYPQIQSYLAVLGGMAQLNAVAIPTADAGALVSMLESAYTSMPGAVRPE